VEDVEADDDHGEGDQHADRDRRVGQHREALSRHVDKEALVDRDRLDRDHVAHAAGEEHRRQRGDERLDAEVVDHQPDEQAEDRTGEQDDRDRRRRRPPGFHQPSGDHRRQRHHRPDGQVDAPGENHERHAHGESDEVRVGDQDVGEDLTGDEVVVDEPADGDRDEQQSGGRHHGEVAVPRSGERALEGDALHRHHGSRLTLVAMSTSSPTSGTGGGSAAASAAS
jgi:hypothetical protein